MDEGVRVRIFFTSRTIPYRKIKSIRQLPFWKACLESLNPFRPPMWNAGGMSLTGVVLMETSGIRVVLSPRNPDKFVRLVTSRLNAST